VQHKQMPLKGAGATCPFSNQCMHLLLQSLCDTAKQRHHSHPASLVSNLVILDYTFRSQDKHESPD